ncbi:hypothetical protein [Paenibacillus sp. Soil724D2]|uniref:hypothetical protein n=1 Tax=Paenibacillus sp. (strain Soil724D2) TaxID=1736392 RepID=UPI000715C2C7|nr:hypothetical protein [Paenibacillus sp. Soil724D2]KRE50671.1 hypothetical protein ASG85_20695 [Paenibacillus sp. Soil724D2]
MTNQAKELLLDLLKLKVRYSVKEFEQVAEVLKDGSEPFLADVVKLIQQLEGVSENKPNTRTKRKAISTDFDINKNTDPEIQELLFEINRMLQSKDTFRVVKELQNFVSRKIVLTAAKNTKIELINKYMSYISARPRDEMINELQLLKDKMNSGDVSSFLNMANAIVSSRKEKRY